MRCNMRPQNAIAPVLVADPNAPRFLAGSGVPDRLTLVRTAQLGDMAVLTYRLAGR